MLKNLILALLMASPLLLSAQKKINYKKVKKCQDLSVPEMNLSFQKGDKALLVFPHSDDEIVVAGLVAHFVQHGVEVHLLNLGRGSRPAEEEARSAELKCSGEQLGLASVERAWLPGNTWENIMQNKVEFWYDEQDSIRSVVKRRMQALQPDILVTYDTELGGYGHPEHRISAQVTEALFHDAEQFLGENAPRYLLQSTLPDDLESFYLKGSPPYALAQKLTGHPGLPDPDVALEIERYWPVKNRAAACHVSQYRTLSKFYLLIDEERLPEHAQAFHREYYELLQR